MNINQLYTLILVGLLSVGLDGAAQATEVQAVPCIGCMTISDLTKGASLYARSNPSPADGSIVLLVSTTADVSGFFQVASVMMCVSSAGARICTSGGVVQKYAIAVTLTDAAAQSLDLKMYAADIGPVKIPAQYGTSAFSALPVDVGTGIRTAMPILLAPFSGQYYVVLNGKTIFVKPGETIVTVKFNDGTTMKFRLSEDPRSSVAWEFVSAADANGNPLNISAANTTGGGGGAGTPPGPTNPPAPSIPNLCSVRVLTEVCVSAAVVDYGSDNCASGVARWLVPCS